MSKVQEIMKPYRDRIDAVDDKIVDLMIERLGIVREVAQIKLKNKIPAVIEERIAQVIDRAGDRVEAAIPGEIGEDDADRIREIYALMVVICCDLEEELMES
ncbi:MAG: chorismate mutase [Pseudobdellovibrionaceae bacterium]|jgi:chorismate mutase|nr:chorismate mutase [Pseudobdellovibrionaceae bacterium]